MALACNQLKNLDAYCASYVCGDDANHCCPATLECATKTIIPNLIGAGFTFISVVVLIMIIFAGFKFMTSAGDQKQLEGARKTLTFAIIGLVVVLFSIFMVNIISQITGVSCIANFKTFGFDICNK